MAIAELGIILSNSGRHAVGTCGISSFCYANKLLTLLVSQYHISSHGDDYSNDDGDVDDNNNATMLMRIIMVVMIMTTVYMMLL